ncbi:hypothetical protein H4582DRAFT_2079814 [Lactarius indigo]|nr:hypothetical protein H4582DRAFT_2079814 [Lactarius indigo]
MMFLSLNSLRVRDLSSFEFPSSQTVPTTPRRLLLSVLSDPTIPTWGTLYPRMILAATQHTLMALVLHGQTFPCASSGFSLTGLRFPPVCRSRAFHPAITLPPSRGSRSMNASCLLLFDFQSLSTTLFRDEGSRPGPVGWDRIWDRFAAELTALVTLDVGLECRYIKPQYHTADTAAL